MVSYNVIEERSSLKESEIMKRFGTIGKEDILALLIDVDGTVYEKEGNNFLKSRTDQEYQWLSKRLDKSVKEVKKLIKQKKEDMKNPEGRVAMSQVVFSLCISSKEWNNSRTASLPNPSLYFKQNVRLMKAVESLLRKRILIIWNSNSPKEVMNKILTTILGDTCKRTAMVGQNNETAKPSPEFYTKLVFPLLEEKNIPINKVVSIGDRMSDDSTAAARAGISKAVIVEGPGELVEFLESLR